MEKRIPHTNIPHNQRAAVPSRDNRRLMILNEFERRLNQRQSQNFYEPLRKVIRTSSNYMTLGELDASTPSSPLAMIQQYKHLVGSPLESVLENMGDNDPDIQIIALNNLKLDFPMEYENSNSKGFFEVEVFDPQLQPNNELSKHAVIVDIINFKEKSSFPSFNNLSWQTAADYKK